MSLPDDPVLEALRDLPTFVDISSEGPWYKKWRVLVYDDLTVYLDSAYSFKKSAMEASVVAVERAQKVKRQA